MTFERSFVRKDPTAVLDYQFLWTPWLDSDTIQSSDMSVPPEITLETETNTTTTATVWLSGGTAGETYRIVNTIETAGGRTEDWVLFVAMDGVDAATGGSYLSADDAVARLWGRYALEAELTLGDVLVASDELDAMAPFIGSKLDTSGAQARAFPRSINPNGTTNEEEDLPEAVLDWIALAAYNLTASGGGVPAIKSESIGSTSRTYDTPKVSQTNRLMASLNIDSYLLKVGQRVGAYDTWRTHESYPDYPLA